MSDMEVKEIVVDETEDEGYVPLDIKEEKTTIVPGWVYLLIIGLLIGAGLIIYFLFVARRP